MRLLSPLVALPLAATLAGCLETPPPMVAPECRPPPAEPCEPWVGAAERYRLIDFDFGTVDPRDPDIAPGFDIDCRVSDDTDSTACFQLDYTSPDGHRGVDNQLGPVAASAPIGALEVSPPALDLEVFEIDPAGLDACFGARVIDTASGEVIAASEYALPSKRGWYARLGPLSFALLIASSDAAVALPVDFPVGHLAIERQDGDTIRGTLGGELSLDRIIPSAQALYPGYEDETRSVLEGQADLHPVADGFCTAISIALTFSARRVD